MAGLNDWLKLNSNALVDLVNKKYVPAEMTEEPILGGARSITDGIYNSGR
jgi:hypothetical protein